LEGFGEFVAARGQSLHLTALALTGDRTSAEDLVQEALTRTASRWRKVLRGGDPEAYVRAVMLNEVRSQWRRRGRRLEVATPEVPEVGVADNQDEVVNRLSFEKVLRRLSPRQRAAIYLRYYEDLSVAEAAELMRCSAGTVKRLCFDALGQIRKLAPDLLTEDEIQELG
jgi:RNA polymerase sigma-70 factor (sigma-E family)